MKKLPFIPNLILEEAQILFENFAGRQSQYNRAGERNFCVIIPDELVDKLIADGWNIKFTKPQSDEHQPQPYLRVNVSYNPYPPMVFMVTKQKTLLNEETVGLLDSSVLLPADIVINPSRYDVNGTTGVSAYLKKGYFPIEQDDLDLKYQDMPMSRNDNQ